jgi:hypothetical protein
MAMRTEHERNRNELTGPSYAGVDRSPSACPPTLHNKYCIVYSKTDGQRNLN